ncbi:hypothetical protein H8D04_01270 [bacterium]|nr:hypothetical protein [bacterium]
MGKNRIKLKYKIKSWENDLGEIVYHPYKKRWFGLYTSLGYGSGNLLYAEDMLRLDAVNETKIETIYYDVEVNGDSVKMRIKEK